MGGGGIGGKVGGTAVGGKVGGTAVGGKVGVAGNGGRGGFSDRRSSKRRESMRVRIDALNLYSRFFIFISIVLILKTFNTSDVRWVQFCGEFILSKVIFVFSDLFGRGLT